VWTLGRVSSSGASLGGATSAGTALPDVRLDARDISFTPSLPQVGDTVAVRFRLSNSGDSDAVGVPVSLSVDGKIVATDTFDVAKGRSTLAGLEWNSGEAGRTARAAAGGRRAVTAAGGGAVLLVDPAGTMRQKSTQEKSAALPQFSLSEGTTAGGGFGRQRLTLEVPEGECVGVRLDSGSTGMCGSADLEFTVGDLAGGVYMMAAPQGIASLGTVSPDAAPTAGVSFAPEAPAMAGNSYAVQLRNGGMAVVTVEVIRNPQQLSGRTAKVFGTGGRRGTPGIGSGTGAVETGDTAGSSAQGPAVFFRISYRSQ
jgi:hypothetical protein